MQVPVAVVLNANTKRETGKKAQYGNIAAAKAVADIVRTTLGPRAMLKMLLDASGGIILTNDGNAILREIDVSHPAAKSIIELSRTQDEEVGDGTTSVIILAGEMLHAAEPFLERHLHPTVIIRGFVKALEDALAVVDELAFPIDIHDREQMLKIIASCIGTKFTSRFGTLMPELALDAVQSVTVEIPGGGREIDVKKYAKVEKLPGGSIEDCRVLKGVMFQKDVVAPGRMRRKISAPRVLLLDCPLEYKKGENQTNVELTKEEDWAALLKLEEDYIERQCAEIVKHKPDLVITEKGLSDLAMHFLTKAGISAIRRLRKTDNNRIARATGATIVHRVEEIRDQDIGTKAGLFEVLKIGDEFYSFIVDCKDPKACTILLRGASKDVLNEVERNLHDAMGVARNVMMDPRLVPGGGAVEMAISRGLYERSASIQGTQQGPYKAAGQALEVIPRTLAQNCGTNVIRALTKLRAKHSEKGSSTFGIDGNKGTIVDMKELGVWEPYEVKAQTIKTAIESATLLLRIDDIVSGIQKKNKMAPGQSSAPQAEDPDQVDSEQMIGE
ncbi:g3450 [Coccomyxa viridis]|uniref:T-complex protein 1 subunit gamma n=1 Tax=Coccomyxa viridis TaxID=1274662 RepID=A0ABP1FMU3_9CHLO